MAKCIVCGEVNRAHTEEEKRLCLVTILSRDFSVVTEIGHMDMGWGYTLPEEFRG